MNNDVRSVEVEGGARRSKLCKDGRLVERYFDDVSTIYEGFLRGLSLKNGELPCLGARRDNGVSGPYHFHTYAEVQRMAHQLGSAIVGHLSLVPGQNTFIGIYAKNRVEWTVLDIACEMFSMPTVPLYDTLGKEAQLFIINQAKVQLVLIDDVKRTESLLKDAEKIKSLKHIVVTFSEIPETIVNLAKAEQIGVHYYGDLLTHGQKSLRDPQPPKPSDIYTVCYTSGTTGMPKGVIITHANQMSAISAFFATEQLKVVETGSDTTVLAYLPLAHILERSVENLTICLGGRIGYYSGDVRNMPQDAQDVRPTLFACVPRVVNRLVDRVYSAVQEGGCLKQWVFKSAISSKTSLLQSGVLTKDTFWDRLVFKKIRDMLGGRIDVIICGSAPIHPSALEFMRAAFGCFVVEGYGQTETSCGISLSIADDPEIGNVGPPIPNCLVKLMDVPEMNYFSSKNQGEVCVKGPACTSGYLNDPEKTAELIDSDGWLHTGDIGEWTARGCLKIIDRKKHIFKLAQGEYVAPEKIEMVYARSRYVAQLFVDGDSLQTCTVAIVVPNEEPVKKLVAENGKTWASLNNNGDSNRSFEELCELPEVNDAILQDLIQIGKADGLNGVEQIKGCYLTSKPFTIEDDLLTQTMKVKRPEVRKRYKEQIAQMYAAINARLANGGPHA